MSEQKINKDSTLMIRIVKDFRIKYKNYCEDNGFTMSKRIISLMKNDMNGKITINK